MASAKSAWGIEVGNRALKAVKLVLEEGRLQVVDIDVIEHEQILSNAGDNKESMIQSAVAHFVEHHQLKGIPVAIGVSGQSSFARFIKLPPVETKKIPEIVRFEAIQQIPFPLEEVEWSYQLFQAPDSPDVEVGIFAMRRELVNRQIAYFKSAGMTVHTVQMNPLAVYNAMYYDQRLKDGTTMIVDVGAENTDLIIADGETVWLRTLPIGGNNFTESLAKAFKVNFVKAEELKRTASTSRYAKQIFQAMRPIFGDLVAEIQRSIGFYASVHRDSRIKKIIALGGTFRLPTLQKYLQQNLQLDVERLDGFSGGAPPDGRLATVLNDNLISMVGAYGLAAQALGEGKITSSLLPAEIRRERIWKEKTKWFATAAALFVVGALAIGGKLYVEQSTFESQGEGTGSVRHKNDDIAKKIATDDANWRKISVATDVDHQISNLDALPKYRDLWPRLIGDISMHLPRELNMKQPRENRSEVVLQGIASQYVENIDRFLIGKMTNDDFLREGASMLGTGSGERRFYQPDANANQAASNAPGHRGFLINIKCTCPRKDTPNFINSDFIDRLMLINEKSATSDQKPYYVDRAVLLLAEEIFRDKELLDKAKTAALDQSKNSPNAYITSPAPLDPAAPPATAPVVENSPLVDPRNGESMLNDWEVNVLVAVVLDPHAAPEKAASRPPAPKGPGR